MKPKVQGRQAFNFLLSYNRVIDKLKTDKQQLELLNIIRKVHFLQIKIDDVVIKDEMVDLAFDSIKHSLEKSVYAYLDKASPEDLGVYSTSEHSTQECTPHSIEHSTPQVEEEEKEQVQKKTSEYDDFLSQLKKACKYKSKVTKTKEGAKLFKAIQDKGKLFEDYIQHQLDKDNYAVVITKFMEDYETVHSQTIQEKVSNPYGY